MYYYVFKSTHHKVMRSGLLGTFTSRREALHCVDADNTSCASYRIIENSQPPIQYCICGVHKNTHHYVEVGTFITKDEAFNALCKVHNDNYAYYIDEVIVDILRG